MNHFLHLRSRVLQSLILGLVVFTFYTCYRTTLEDYRPVTVPVDVASLPNTSDALQQSPKNTTSDPLLTNAIAPHNATSSTGPTSISTSQGPQSSASTSINLSSNDPTLHTPNATVTKPTIHQKDSAGAIYQPGHDVTAWEKCLDKGEGKTLVIVITSAPSHSEARTAIRQTWGHYGQRRDVSIVFMLGRTKDPKLEISLDEEQNLYRDVIRGRFIDSYSNLTLKTISTLEWVNTYCSEAKFLLKTDDDMFINIPRLLSFIDKHKNTTNAIFGRLAHNWKPIRNKKSKYYVSQAQYKPLQYPDFTTGPAYLLPRNVTRALYETALSQTYLKLEDVFTTGIVAQKLGIERVHVNEFLNKKIAYNACNVQRSISIHMVKYGEQFDLWKKLMDRKIKCKKE
ncbi:beta-1,3-galactosyltransferase 1 isoform X2 [Diachasma alloeum]|uniref:beta-1,3-galactosyltransferase 1 isoform X2 n=1 Tax=Diachasma alloeum TaxID=454923 RepID=UPI0007382812|nr:beta-1,3-galactosyltransferase 1 isoform X2 [Diachasma alloeum]